MLVGVFLMIGSEHRPSVLPDALTRTVPRAKKMDVAGRRSSHSHRASGVDRYSLTHTSARPSAWLHKAR